MKPTRCAPALTFFFLSPGQAGAGFVHSTVDQRYLVLVRGMAGQCMPHVKLSQGCIIGQICMHG